jgi:hypothetical protein
MPTNISEFLMVVITLIVCFAFWAFVGWIAIELFT